MQPSCPACTFYCEWCFTTVQINEWMNEWMNHFSKCRKNPSTHFGEILLIVIITVYYVRVWCEKVNVKEAYLYSAYGAYYELGLLISRRSGMSRVNEGSHSFTCHPHVYPQVEWTIPTFNPQPQSITALWLVLISRPAEGRRDWRVSWPRVAWWNIEVVDVVCSSEDGHPSQY